MILVEKQIGVVSDRRTSFLATQFCLHFNCCEENIARLAAAAMAPQKNICRLDQAGSIPPSPRNIFE